MSIEVCSLAVPVDGSCAIWDYCHNLGITSSITYSITSSQDIIFQKGSKAYSRHFPEMSPKRPRHVSEMSQICFRYVWHICDWHHSSPGLSRYLAAQNTHFSLTPNKLNRSLLSHCNLLSLQSQSQIHEDKTIYVPSIELSHSKTRISSELWSETDLHRLLKKFKSSLLMAKIYTQIHFLPITP